MIRSALRAAVTLPIVSWDGMPQQKSSDVLRGFYEAADRVLEESFARARGKGEPPVSCRAGCAHCCDQMVSIGTADALTLAEYVAAVPDAPAWIERIAEAARGTPPTLTRRAYFDRRIPCVFLDRESKRCRVYERRPAACRLHFVVTPAENCSHNGPGTATATAKLDLRPLEAEVGRLDLAIHEQNPRLGVRAVAPLPLMIIWALANTADLPLLLTLKRAVRGLPSPQDWLAAWVETRV